MHASVKILTLKMLTIAIYVFLVLLVVNYVEGYCRKCGLVHPTILQKVQHVRHASISTSTSQNHQTIREQVEKVIKNMTMDSDLSLKSIRWVADRCEVIVDSSASPLNSNAVGDIHNKLYTQLSSDMKFSKFLEDYEVSCLMCNK